VQGRTLVGGADAGGVLTPSGGVVSLTEERIGWKEEEIGECLKEQEKEEECNKIRI